MCACTEPVRTDIGAACVEYGRSKWLINQTHVQKNVFISSFERSEFLIATCKKKKTDRLCVCPDVRLILILVYNNLFWF